MSFKIFVKQSLILFYYFLGGTKIKTMHEKISYLKLVVESSLIALSSDLDVLIMRIPLVNHTVSVKSTSKKVSTYSNIITAQNIISQSLAITTSIESTNVEKNIDDNFVNNQSYAQDPFIFR